jgi:hypothetical protein
MGAFLFALIAAVDPTHDIAGRLAAMVFSLFLIFLELIFVLALATFFSTFSTPIMSVIFTLALWFIGHLGSSLLDLSRMSNNEGARKTLECIYWCLPDLAQLTRLRSMIMYGKDPFSEIIIYMVAYVLAFVLILLGLASVVNERREFP